LKLEKIQNTPNILQGLMDPDEEGKNCMGDSYENKQIIDYRKK
jgi:hypothetical protein